MSAPPLASAGGAFVVKGAGRLSHMNGRTPIEAVIAYRKGATPWCCPMCGCEWTMPRWRVLVCPNQRCRFTFPLP